MITNFKIFENKKSKKLYWLIPTDDRMKDSLKQIKLPKVFINSMLDQNFIRWNENKYIFVCYDGPSNKCGWNPYKGNILDDYFEQNGYSFAGKINLEDYELDAIKYNL